MESDDRHRIVRIYIVHLPLRRDISLFVSTSRADCFALIRDRIGSQICEKTGIKLSLPQVLEAATWKGGREIAKKLRPSNAGPPIEIQSDGTVF